MIKEQIEWVMKKIIKAKKASSIKKTMEFYQYPDQTKLCKCGEEIKTCPYCNINKYGI